jgi:hypothetical protein
MKEVFSITLITAVIALLEIPSLAKQKLSKDLFIFVGLLAFAFILGTLQGLKVELQNPFDWITYIFNPMTKIIQRTLE